MSSALICGSEVAIRYLPSRRCSALTLALLTFNRPGRLLGQPAAQRRMVTQRALGAHMRGLVAGLGLVAGGTAGVAATIGTLALLAVGVASARTARRRLSYETWHTLHLLTYAAVALSFVHELAGPDL